MRDATAPHRNTLSNAKWTRDTKFIQTVFWKQLAHFQSEQPAFLHDVARRYFRLPKRLKRAVRAIDSTAIELIAKCMEWGKHRKRKAASKLHMAIDVVLVEREAAIDRHFLEATAAHAVVVAFDHGVVLIIREAHGAIFCVVNSCPNAHICLDGGLLPRHKKRSVVPRFL